MVRGHISAGSMTSLLVNKVHLLLFAVGVALYVNTLPGELLFDDNEAIVTNRDVRSGFHTNPRTVLSVCACDVKLCVLAAHCSSCLVCALLLCLIVV